LKNTYVEQLRLGTSNTFLSTFHENFVRLELFPGFSFAVLGGLTRESDLDRVLLFETNSILATLADKRGMVLRRNLEDLRGFIRLKKKI